MSGSSRSTWLATVREGHPDKGPQNQAELTVLP